MKNTDNLRLMTNIFMTKNTKRISSLIILIIAVVIGSAYPFIDFKGLISRVTHRDIQTVQNNDVWSGEPFSALG